MGKQTISFKTIYLWKELSTDFEEVAYLLCQKSSTLRTVKPIHELVNFVIYLTNKEA